MAYGNQKRRHGNVWYGAKYAARGLGAGISYGFGGSAHKGWKKGGKIFKRVFGGIRGPRARLGSNTQNRNYGTGSNRGPRLGSNKGGQFTLNYNGRVGSGKKAHFTKYTYKKRY